MIENLFFLLLLLFVRETLWSLNALLLLSSSSFACNRSWRRLLVCSLDPSCSCAPVVIWWPSREPSKVAYRELETPPFLLALDVFLLQKYWSKISATVKLFHPSARVAVFFSGTIWILDSGMVLPSLACLNSCNVVLFWDRMPNSKIQTHDCSTRSYDSFKRRIRKESEPRRTYSDMPVLLYPIGHNQILF